jgi:threonylcarbamoyladenosine tRNA methylthiotransferase MtaB
LKKIYLTYLGCKVNQYEVQLLKEWLQTLNCCIVSNPEDADICIINTCSVTANSDKKSKKTVEKIMQLNSQADIVVCGCCVDNEFSSVNLIRGPKYFISNENKLSIPKILGITKDNCINGITTFSDREKAFVKIQDGCDNYCSYCIVAHTRGVAQSRNKDDILTEIKQLTANGYREIVLTGINIGYYGKDNASNLVELLKEAVTINNLGRLRLSSLNPDDINLDLIRFIKENDKICNHFHISIQSADAQILKIMNRKYSSKHLMEILQTIKDEIPSAGLSGDFICGFPQETDSNFQNTLNLFNNFDFIRSHIFTYSDREKTAAFRLKPKIPDRIKKDRAKILRRAAFKSANRYINKCIGQEIEVLVEHKPDSKMQMLCGYSDTYIKVLVKNLPVSYKGQLIKVKVLNNTENRVISCLKKP